MIPVKNRDEISRIEMAGSLLSELFDQLRSRVVDGITTLEIDHFIAQELKNKDLCSMTKGYMGYKHVSCISLNEEVVHGVPHARKKLRQGDLVKIDICASWRGYCADMARPFFVGIPKEQDARVQFVDTAQSALNNGIAQAKIGGRLGDISAAIQQTIEVMGYGVVRDFAGHGLGKRMHEEPEILNYGKAGSGALLREGMVFAIEPMLTMGNYKVYVTDDDWTVKTVDGSVAMHIEDTIIVTKDGPQIVTRNNSLKIKKNSRVGGEEL